jgi:menaquinol-cytochrome c reductase iron-sulfur subunit
MARRDFLKKLALLGGGTVVTAVVGIPSLALLLSPVLRDRKGSAWRPIGELAEFPVGKVSKAVFDPARRDWAGSVREQAVYVRREPDGTAVVFSRSCTDVGCAVNHDAGSDCFFCPCHGGIFDGNGVPMAGPPPRPLYRYATRVVDGVLEIDLRSVPPMV